MTVAVRGFDHHLAVDQRSDKQYVDHVIVPPGHYLLRSYVPTRVALWFLGNGLFGDLRRPCNWMLVFVEGGAVVLPPFHRVINLKASTEPNPVAWS